MHRIACLLVGLAACQKGSPAAQDGSEPLVDASPDAPADAAACAHIVSGTTVGLRQIGAVDSTGAVLATSPPNDPRLFVVEQRGTIRLLVDEVLQPQPFLDLLSLTVFIGGGDEKGLLGLAFHPQFASNGQLFVYFTGARNGDLWDFLDRCTLAPGASQVDPASCVEVIGVKDIGGSNHNGGMLEFGPDGYLYISTGDGGSAGDPMRVAQDTNSIFGKILRIDVDHPSNGKLYGIPSDNPFVAGGAPEVFIYGLRNPWRWSFDRGTGDMWIGDVGQGEVEELDVLRAGQQRGVNFGWSVYEGDRCCLTEDSKCIQVAPQQPCDPTGMTFPKDSHLHSEGWAAIIDGQTYRGSCYPDLVGWHFYSDYQAMPLLRARLKPDDSLEIVDTGLVLPAPPSSLHGDSRGELYLTTTTGGVYHLEAQP